MNHHGGSADHGLACATSVALAGLDGRIVEVEADIGPGLPRTVLVGLPDAALHEAKDRCKAAVHNAGQQLAGLPADDQPLPGDAAEAGSRYDLAIVAAVLAAGEVIRASSWPDTVLLGELGLDARIRPVRGILPATLAAAQAGYRRVIVPLRQAEEAGLVEDIEVIGLASLVQLVALSAVSRCPGRAGRAAPTSPRRHSAGRGIWPTSPVSWRRGGRSRSPRPVGITCFCTGRPGWARRCWPSGCRACCPSSA